MNKYLLSFFFVILSAISLYCQNKTKILQFEKSTFDKSMLNSKFHKFDLWKIKSDNNVDSAIQKLQIQLSDSIISFVVENNNNLTKPDFVVTANGKHFSKDISLINLNTTKGEKNECRISIAKDFILGSFKIGSESFIIEQVNNFISEAEKNLVIIYNIKDEIKTEVKCGTETVNDNKKTISLSNNTPQITNGICRVIDYAIAVDYSSFQNHGSSINQTSNYILAIMNMVEGNYVGVFTDDLYYKISEILIFTSPQVNPWTFNPDIAANLNLFTSWAPTGFTKPFDDASYWYTQAGIFQPVGFAWVNTTCATNGFNTNVIREYGGTTDNMRCLVAHEIGHNFGCGHTAGFIMNPSVNNATTWAPESITTVNNTIIGSGGTCIAACNYTNCETLVTSDATVTDNGSQLIINWTATANPTRVEYRNSTTGSFTLVGTYNTPTNTATINHNSNCNVTEYFQIRVTSICPNTNTGVPSIIAIQSIGGNPPTPTISIAATSSNQCSATFVATISNGGTTPIFQWKVNGVNVGTNANTFTSVNLNNNDIVSCILTSSLSCVTANNITSNSITFQGPLPTISITANSTIFCGGTNVTFTATITNGGSSPIYQWKVNGVNVGTNANSYSTTSLNHNDIVTCILTSSIICATTNDITSNGITVTLTAPVSNFNFTKAGLIVNFSNLSTCAASYIWNFGDGSTSTLANPTHTYATSGIYNVCFTVTNVNGSNQKCLSIPVFNSWVDNMNDVTDGIGTAITYQNSQCDRASEFKRYSATNPALNSYITYPQNDWMPAQGSLEFSIKINNGQTWAGTSTTVATIFGVGNASTTAGSFIAAYSNGNIVFRRYNGSTFTDVTATATPFRFNEWHIISVSYGTAGTSIAVDGTVFVTNTTANFSLNQGVTTLGQVAYQNNLWFGFEGLVDKFRISYSQSDFQLAAAIQPPTATINASANIICAGTPVTFTASTNAPTANYQWKKNGVNVGTNSSTYTDNGLVNGNTVNCIVSATSGCFSNNPGTSNTIIVLVNAPITPNASIVASQNNICTGTPVTFTATTNAPTANYQWKKNGVNVGTNSSTYTDNGLVNSDVVSCVVTATSGCFNSNPGVSNTITMFVTVQITPSVNIAVTKTNPCIGELVTFTATPVNGGASPTYQWFKNGSSIATGVSFSSAILNNGDIINCVLTTSAGCYTSFTATSNNITLTVRPIVTPSASITASATNICASTNVTFTASTNIVNPSYQWKVNGNNVGTNISSFNSITLTNADVINCVITAPTSDCYTIYSINTTGIQITVRPLLVPSITITSNDADNIICQGQPVIYTATSLNGGTNPIYQWKKNGVNVGTNSLTYTLNGPADNDEISCVLISNEVCILANNVESNKIKLEVPVVNPVVIKNGYTLTVGTVRNGAAFQWYKDGQPILGSTSSSYTVTLFGNYSVLETYKACSKTSSIVILNPFTVNNNDDIRIYPNPANNLLFAQTQNAGIYITAARIYDAKGSLVLTQTFNNNNTVQLNITGLPSSVYFLEFQTNGKLIKRKFIKQ